ncbi:hypothetical protein [Mycobacterium sp. 236(2023)]|uniref:hypothetical protein n=1 Tax=Mycobacterium sp. 236(2023) TaxID=3038163 RepID=UPI002414D9C3|nr:hypothetical protein [Mycobacterium sp. 236(2023)]MDG4668652.1 hypothetical protein [Mycobacterium sp. 236(2023)]
MAIGEYAGIQLQDEKGTWQHGAVFLLRKAARRSCSVLLDGWLTTVAAKQRFVIVRGPSTATNFGTTLTEALNAANRSLDYMSVTGMADCAIRDASDDCLVWWPDSAEGGVVMRCRATQWFGMDITMTAEVRNSDGTLRPSPPPPTPIADDVFRFVRTCRTSDDLFDAYRNLFLAFESLLSDIRPRRQVASAPPNQRWWQCRKAAAQHNSMKWETEESWFTAALEEAHKLVSLESLTPPNVTNHRKWIYKHIYQRERSALMHAKRGQGYLLPHDAASKAELTESLGRLWEYVACQFRSESEQVFPVEK